MSSASKIIQAAAGNAGEALYVEDVFSTYLYTGNGSTQTITNDIDIDGEGGLVWTKMRSTAQSHRLWDTERGDFQSLQSDKTDPSENNTNSLSFNSDGFSLGNSAVVNFGANSDTYASWTFRKAPKFFDVVTYTGTGSATTVSHNLGSVPGCIMVKRTDTTGDWQVYHRANTANPETDYLVLNSNAATADSNTRWNDTAPTDSVFTVGTEATVNASGGTYVAYLWAHNNGDGEFGEEADQDIIKCGSYTGNGNADGPEIDLGFEPQFVIIKAATVADQWIMFDSMRGWTASGGKDYYLFAEASLAETGVDRVNILQNGFKPADTNQLVNGSGQTYIYIAIRRGPMKTPESGTEVFATDTLGGTLPNPPGYYSGFAADWSLSKRTDSTGDWFVGSRLTQGGYLKTNTTDAEVNEGTTSITAFDYSDGVRDSTTVNSGFRGYMFRRAPGFFDVVAYTGDDFSNKTLTHNLGATPELIIAKNRGTGNWEVGVNFTATNCQRLYLNLDAGASTIPLNNASSEFSSVSAETFQVGDQLNINTDDYIAYLFASLDGVSKVGSYTGNGTSQTIDCGFSAGARFVMTKRTNTTGNWNVWDSERGIVAGNDPRLELNTTDAEDTGHDYIDPDSSGFVVNYVADDDDDSNVSGDTYIFLAIA